MNKKNHSFEENMQRLEQIVRAMERGDVPRDEIHRSMALTMARSAAIVVGQVLTAEEMARLIDELFACEMPAYTPDGKLVFIIIEDSQIKRLFC